MAGDSWGIDDGYEDVAGQWHTTPEHTRRALRVAMGGMADIDDPPPRTRPVWFVRHGSGPTIERPAELVLEDGSVQWAADRLPPDLPIGYHELHPSDGGTVTRLIVTPERSHSPAGLRAWGLTVQLYAARSRASWGIGDLGDLARIAEWVSAASGGFVALNPLHAPLPGPEPDDSPYYPSTRRWRSPLHLRIEDVPGWERRDAAVDDIARRALALDGERTIDRSRVWAAKREALEHLWAAFPGDPDFDAFLAEHGAGLATYGAFCALVEHYGSPWHDWPGEHRRPDHPGVERFAAEHGDTVRFHCWLQWLVDRQLHGAGAVTAVITDLAIGFDPAGFDAWEWQDVVALKVRVGAPPDLFNPRGQDWGLPPFVPWKLRAAGYRPWAETVRAALRHAGGIRVDHVMGLFRLFWIPPGSAPEDGGYVRFPGTELLDVLALESVRAGAMVVGEDLGTVESSARDLLRERGVLSYRLVWFEDDPPWRFPEQALAAVSTHDLPTIAGLWTGADAAARTEIGLTVDPAADAALRTRLAAAAGVSADATVTEVVAGVYESLAASPSQLVSATLDDLLEVEERPNFPGTIDEWPNWRIALPVALDDALADERVVAAAAALTAARPAVAAPTD